MKYEMAMNNKGGNERRTVRDRRGWADRANRDHDRLCLRRRCFVPRHIISAGDVTEISRPT